MLDATVVSNFATSESLDWLGRSLPGIAVPEAVLDEVLEGVNVGHSFLSNAVES